MNLEPGTCLRLLGAEVATEEGASELPSSLENPKTPRRLGTESGPDHCRSDMNIRLHRAGDGNRLMFEPVSLGGVLP